MSSFLGSEEFEALANEYSQYITPSEANLISVIDGDANSSVMYGVGEVRFKFRDLAKSISEAAAMDKIRKLRREFAEGVTKIYFVNRSTGKYHTGEKFGRMYNQFISDINNPKLLTEISKLFGNTPMAPFILFCEIFCGREPIVPRQISKQDLALNFHILHIQALRESASRAAKPFISLTKRTRESVSGTGEYMDPEQVADSIDHLRLLPRSTVSMNNRYPLPPK
jgi:hypothetical protein